MMETLVSPCCAGGMTLTFRSITLITALFAGASAGILLAFSSVVMPALRRLPPGPAVSAMNAINLAAPRSPWFMVALFGSAIGAIVVAVWALTHGMAPGRGWLLTGAAGAVATVVITVGFHVPRNDALLAMDPIAAATVWPGWAASWTAMNSVRTATGLIGAVCLVLGARAGR